MEKEVFGVYVVEKRAAFNLFYNLILGKHEKGWRENPKGRIAFIASPKIRKIVGQILNKGTLESGSTIGIIQIRIDRENRVFRTSSYYPITIQSSIPYDVFQKKGLASTAELCIIRHLNKQFRGWKIGSTSDPKWPRMEQLMKQKRPVGESEPLPVAARKIRNYLVGGARKMRPR